MTDGNMAANVSPVSTEDADMSKVREVFDRAINALVNASTLARQVDELATKLSTLQNQVEHYVRQNSWLEESLTRVRAERDESIRKLNQITTEVDYERAKVETLGVAKSVADNTIAQLTDELERTRKERDEHHFNSLELQDKLQAFSVKMDEIKAFAKGLISEVAPTPSAPIEPSADPMTEPKPDAMQVPVREGITPPKPWWEEQQEQKEHKHSIF
jgi:chromosome segregation ATPase